MQQLATKGWPPPGPAVQRPWPSQRPCTHSRCPPTWSSHPSNPTSRDNKGSPSNPSRSSVCCKAQKAVAAAAAAAATGNHVLEGALQVEARTAFLAELLAHGVCLPMFGGWLLVTALSSVASRARQWCDDNPDEPLSIELLGLLPAALENPTRVAVALFVTTRVLRNIAAGLASYIHVFKPQWDDWADAAAQTVVAWLGPFDQGLLRLYTVVAVLAGARVLIKWKSIALEFVLHQRAGLSYAWPVIPRRRIQKGGNNTSSSSTKGKGAVNTRSSGSSTSQAAKPAAAKPASAAVMSVDDGDDGFDEAACVQREGSMLCVSMRPRSASSASGTGEDRQAAAAGSRGGAAAGMDGGSSKAAVGGWRGSSSGSSSGGQGEVPWPAQSTQDDGVERLLLPLDSILSWAIAVMAGLFAVHTLGINIKPLLAVGGASSLIIGLATQTLLTNAVMGVSIFLSRPFVPGDSITVQQQGGVLVSGVVEKVTPMRTLLRTDDDVLVTLPNKTIADMIVYNKSRREARSRLVARSWERPFLKFKVKLPNKELNNLQDLQQDLLKVLKRPGVQQQSVELCLSKFTDSGADMLLQFLLLVAAGSPTSQQLLVDLAFTVRKHGGTLVSIL